MVNKRTSISCNFSKEISVGAVNNQLQRIMGSPVFTATESQRDFLSFVVSETLAGRSEEIKGFTVATRVLGRRKDFDQAVDPIVSIQASKLRRAMERYYLIIGHNDPVHIDIPKGTYVPVFNEQTVHKPVPESISGTDESTDVEGAWPTIFIRHFVNLTGDNSLDWLGRGFASQLRMEMTQHQDIKVINIIPDGVGKRETDTIARFVIDGEILKSTTGISVIITLTDTKTNLQLWANKLNSDNDPSRLIGFQKEIVQTVAAQIGCEYGIIASTIITESSEKAPKKLKTYEAILKYIEFNQTPTEEHFMQALTALDYAKNIEPRCSKIWSMLARIHAAIFCLEVPGFDLGDARKKAISYAEKGVGLAPDNQHARAVLAFVRLITDEIAAGQREIKLAYDLQPDSVILLDSIGYVMVLLGEWQQGVELIRKATRINPYHPDYVYYALWVNWIRQEDYQQAYLETMQLRSPQIFWEPLVKASTLGNLDRLKEGKQYAEDLLTLKPDFPTRGRVLIGYHIKPEKIIQRTIEGLSKVGLELE